MLGTSIRALVILTAAVFVAVSRGDDQTMPGQTALTDGCIADVSIFPHYAPVRTRTMPESGVYGWVRYSHVADSDLPLDHEWHDVNFYVALDTGDTYNSKGNFLNENSYLEYGSNSADRGPWQSTPSSWLSNHGERLMEVEWDLSHVPERFWAFAGDRVWLKGRYIWDCGHDDPEIKETAPKGASYHTEIHPPKAVAITRMEPYKFSGDANYSVTTKTYVYIHGGSGLRNLTSDQTSAVATGTLDVPVATEDYKFQIDLPKRPAGVAGDPVFQVVELPYGGPSPVLSYDSSAQKINVVYPLNLGDPSPDRRFGAVIVAGWRQPPAVAYKTVKVGVMQIEIHNHHNAACLSNWEMWISVNGDWRQVKGTSGLCVGSLIDVNSEWDVVVPDDVNSRVVIQAVGWVSVFDSVFGSPNDILRIATSLPETEHLLGLVGTGGKIGRVFQTYSVRVGAAVPQISSSLTSLASAQAEEVDGDPASPEIGGDFVLKLQIMVQ